MTLNRPRPLAGSVPIPAFPLSSRSRQIIKPPGRIRCITLRNFDPAPLPFNDTYGHLAGDEYLRCIASVLKSGFKRCPDVIARYGGEEFAILAPETPEADVARLAERRRARIQEFVASYSGRQLCTTVSIGIAGEQADYRQTSENLIQGADEALYRAKNDGRNQVCIHIPSDTATAPSGLNRGLKPPAQVFRPTLPSGFADVSAIRTGGRS